MNYCIGCLSQINDYENICPYCGQDQHPEIPAHHLVPGTTLIGKYLIGKAIGEGGFGITYIGRDLVLDLKVAIKEYYPNGFVNRSGSVSPHVTFVTTNADMQSFFLNGKEKFLNEARALAQFSGEPGIVWVRDFFESNDTAYIVMEYLEGITLKDYIKQNGLMTPDAAVRLLLPLMESLGHVHQKNLIHRDISPDNIMLVNGHPKLLDFGAARTVSSISAKSLSVVLKPGYAPEEQYRTKGEQGPWTDIYSLCATIYKCITGITPDDATQRMFRDELKSPSELGIPISPQLEQALLKGMSVLYVNRYKSIDELIAAFTNPAITADSASPVKASGQTPEKNAHNTPGENMKGSDKAIKTPAKKKNKAPLIIAAVAALAIVVVVVIILLPRNKSDDPSKEVSSDNPKPTENVEITGEPAEPTATGEPGKDLDNDPDNVTDNPITELRPENKPQSENLSKADVNQDGKVDENDDLNMDGAIDDYDHELFSRIKDIDLNSIGDLNDDGTVDLFDGQEYFKVRDETNEEEIKQFIINSKLPEDRFVIKKIKAGESITDKLIDISDYRIYRFFISEPGKVWTSFMHEYFEDEENYWIINFYTYDGDLITSVTRSGNVSGYKESRSLGLPKGIYYMILTTCNGKYSDLPYNLILNYDPSEKWEQEFNDTKPNANLIPINEEIHGSIISDDDDDWYTFVVSQEETLSVDFGNLKADKDSNYWNAYIYSESGDELLNASFHGNQSDYEHSGSITLKPGKYYFRVTIGEKRTVYEYFFKLNSTKGN